MQATHKHIFVYITHDINSLHIKCTIIKILLFIYEYISYFIKEDWTAVSEALIPSITLQTFLIGGRDRPHTEEGNIWAKTLGVSGCDIPENVDAALTKNLHYFMRNTKAECKDCYYTDCPHVKFSGSYDDYVSIYIHI